METSGGVLLSANFQVFVNENSNENNCMLSTTCVINSKRLFRKGVIMKSIPYLYRENIHPRGV